MLAWPDWVPEGKTSFTASNSTSPSWKVHHPGLYLCMSPCCRCPSTLVPTCPRLRVRDKLLQSLGGGPIGFLSCSCQRAEHINSATTRSSPRCPHAFSKAVLFLSPFVSPFSVFSLSFPTILYLHFHSLLFLYPYLLSPLFPWTFFPPCRVSFFPGSCHLLQALRAPPGLLHPPQIQMLLRFLAISLHLHFTWPDWFSFFFFLPGIALLLLLAVSSLEASNTPLFLFGSPHRLEGALKSTWLLFVWCKFWISKPQSSLASYRAKVKARVSTETELSCLP